MAEVEGRGKVGVVVGLRISVILNLFVIRHIRVKVCSTTLQQNRDFLTPSWSALSNFALFHIYSSSTVQRGIVTKLGRGHLRYYYYYYYPGQHLAVRKPAKDLNPILSDCADADRFPLVANKEDNKAEREAVLSTKKKKKETTKLL